MSRSIPPASAEALRELLVPHQLCDRPDAKTLARRGISVTFENVVFAYPDCPRLFDKLNFRIESGQRVGLVGASGGGKTSIFALIQRFYDIESGRILIADQDVTQVTQQSLREAIAVVPQDISLFHRSLMENIRYARPEASDAGCVGRGRGRTLRASSRSCRKASTRSSAIAARACREGSASASRSPARS